MLSDQGWVKEPSWRRGALRDPQLESRYTVTAGVHKPLKREVWMPRARQPGLSVGHTHLLPVLPPGCGAQLTLCHGLCHIRTQLLVHESAPPQGPGLDLTHSAICRPSTGPGIQQVHTQGLPIDEGACSVAHNSPAPSTKKM